MQSVLQQGSEDHKGGSARLQSFVGAISIGDLVKTTLGPRGMDKILQPVDMGDKGGSIGKLNVTNDGATILGSVWVDNPAAKILVNISKVQDQQCGDGTTSVVVLAAELLRKAETLIEQKLHPNIVIQGFREAGAVARTKLESLAIKGSEVPNRALLLNIAKTTLSSKLLSHEKDLFANFAVNSVNRLKGKPHLDYINVVKKQGGSLSESFLCGGIILEKTIGVGQPKSLSKCHVLIANTPMDVDRVKIQGARVKVSSFEDVLSIEAAEKEKMKNKVDKICSNKPVNVFINRQLIYDYPMELFREQGVLAIEHSDFDGTERLGAALGGDIVSTFDVPSKLGYCEKIEEILVGEDRMIHFSGCRQNEACTIVLRGASSHILDEAERSLHDAVAVVYQTVQGNPSTTYGAGYCEMAMAAEVMDLARKTEGKKALAIEAFAKGLEQIPVILAENAGFDALDLVSQLRAKLALGGVAYGLDLESGAVSESEGLEVCESLTCKISQLCAAMEAAEQVIRVDEIIRVPPRQRTEN